MILFVWLGCAYEEEIDLDGDGFAVCVLVSVTEGTAVETECEGVESDCDENDPSVYPGASVSCDGHRDHDCDGMHDYLMPDADCDGDGVPRDLGDDGYDEGEDDCADENSARFPGGIEWCGDGVDNDCDGVADEAAFCEEPS